MIVLHVPHAASVVPDEVRGQFLLGDDDLREEILKMTDWHTDRLFRAAARPSVRFPVSRLVVDPERFLDDAAEPMAARGMGVIYTKTSAGRPLRADLGASDRRALIERYYVPHHAALERKVQVSLSRHGGCLVLDCHSFPSVPLPYEPVQDPERPGLCIGSDPFHTPSDLVSCLVEEAESLGWSVAVNTPFAGALVPLRHYRRTPSVIAVMLEMNRGLYLDEATGQVSVRFAETQRGLDQLIEVIDEWQGAASSSG